MKTFTEEEVRASLNQMHAFQSQAQRDTEDYTGTEYWYYLGKRDAFIVAAAHLLAKIERKEED